MDRDAFDEALEVLSRATETMAGSVPTPQLIDIPSNGLRAYRYREATLAQAMVLKMVRTVSALHALQVLIEAGLVLDAGATMRILDELGTDIMFLAGPWRTGSVEPRHNEYLQEFFQEEFDHADPLQATQSRRRVSRKDIRAYVSRVYAETSNVSVSQFSAIVETVESAVSGYVHGASTHILDIYDGRTFVVPAQAGDRPQVVAQRLVPGYVLRALVPAAIAAMAMKRMDLAKELLNAVERLEAAIS